MSMSLKMSSEVEEYFLCSQFLNVAADLNRIIDENIEDFADEYSDYTLEENPGDQSEECDNIDDCQSNDYQNEVDIVQCIINIIELQEILNETHQKTIRKRHKRWGIHPINQMRREQGHFQNLFKEMRAYDHDKFFNYTRMTPERFDHLLKLVNTALTKNAPNAIPPECRLLITLRYFQ